MKIKRCEICPAIIGEWSEDGFVVRSECHKDILVRGVLNITCKNGHKNLVYTEGKK